MIYIPCQSFQETNSRFSLCFHFRLRKSDPENGHREVDDDFLRPDRNPSHATLHDKHRSHSRVELQVHVHETLQVCGSILNSDCDLEKTLENSKLIPICEECARFARQIKLARASRSLLCSSLGKNDEKSPFCRDSPGILSPKF